MEVNRPRASREIEILRIVPEISSLARKRIHLTLGGWISSQRRFSL